MSPSTSSERVTGFLNGYMAGNISANASELKLHTDKIKGLLDEFKKVIEQTRPNDPSSASMKNSIVKLESKAFSADSTPDDYFNYTIEFADLVSEIKNADNTTPLSTEASFLVKRSIYHFLNIAKTVQDKRIIDKATAIAKQFD